MVKYYHAPDVGESLRSGVPKPWLAPDLAQSIRAAAAKQWVDPDLAGDLVAAGAGGGVPDWVPANAKIYIDLIAPGRAWTEDDGEVVIDTLLGSDPNTVNAWDTTSYDPTKLTADGYSQANSEPVAFIGAARTSLIVGSTFRIVVKTLSAQDTTNVVFASADGAAAIEFDLGNGNGGVDGSSWAGSYSESIPLTQNAGATAINVLAATLTATRAEFSANGSNPTSAILTDAELPPSSPLVAGLIESFNAPIQSIAIYDALPDTTGLSALSATGVTNTAPHDMVATEHGSGGTIDSPTSVTVPAENTTAFNPILRAEASDDQGNSLSWTIIDDSGGKFGLYSPGYVRTLEDVLEGVYTITLRATDPGGLYVEQEFTITVTATELAVAGDGSASLSYDGTHYSSVSINNCASLTSVDFASLVTVDDFFQFYACPSLMTLTFGALKKIGGNFNVADAALNEAAVDALLAMLVGLDGTGGTTLFENVSVGIASGTSAPPSGAGLTSKATLEGRGCTVTVNS